MKRVQFDLTPEQVLQMDLLASGLSTRSRADLFQEALGVLHWYVQERRRGRRIVSIDPAETDRLGHVIELALPGAGVLSPDVYEHLVARPHPWRRQLSLKGRSMTVGQLVATMHASDWTPREAADQLAISEAQVLEALRYFGANRDLIDEEFREEAHLVHGATNILHPPGDVNQRPDAATSVS